MRRFFFTVLFIAGISPAIATAQQAPVKSSPPTAASSLTINDCLLILSGLNAIDQHDVVVGNKPNEQVYKQSYEYGSGSFRIALARNIGVLTVIQQAAQAAQQRIFGEVAKGATKIEPGTPEAIEYDKRLKELTGAPCSADIVRIKDSELMKVERNELPAWALSNLEKIRDK